MIRIASKRFNQLVLVGTTVSDALALVEEEPRSTDTANYSPTLKAVLGTGLEMAELPTVVVGGRQGEGA